MRINTWKNFMEYALIIILIILYIVLVNIDVDKNVSLSGFGGYIVFILPIIVNSISELFAGKNIALLLNIYSVVYGLVFIVLLYTMVLAMLIPTIGMLALIFSVGILMILLIEKIIKHFLFKYEK